MVVSPLKPVNVADGQWGTPSAQKPLDMDVGSGGSAHELGDPSSSTTACATKGEEKAAQSGNGGG